MGALDPHVHKRNQQSLSGSHGEVPRGTGDSGQPIPSIDELPVELRPSFATSEDYYSTVVLNPFEHFATVVIVLILLSAFL